MSGLHRYRPARAIKSETTTRRIQWDPAAHTIDFVLNNIKTRKWTGRISKIHNLSKEGWVSKSLQFILEVETKSTYDIPHEALKWWGDGKLRAAQEKLVVGQPPQKIEQLKTKNRKPRKGFLVLRAICLIPKKLSISWWATEKGNFNPPSISKLIL